MKKKLKWILLSLSLSVLLAGIVWYWLYTFTFYTNSLGMTFRRIPAGSFTMGSFPDEPGRSPLDDETAFQVGIAQDFWLQEAEVTQAQWQAVMGKNPAHFQGKDLHPVENISYLEVQQFIAKLNAREEGRYRLPTEAEWEYAVRADQQTPYFFGKDPAELDKYAWYRNNAGKTTHPVKQKDPNPWGLYDMYGNVSEWVHDWYEDYPKEIETNPSGPLTGLNRVVRGGNWIFKAKYCRSAMRHSARPDFKNRGIGFRVLREMDK